MATFIDAANTPASGDGQASSRAVTKPAGAQIAVFFVCFWIGDGDTTITPPGGAVLRNNTVNTDTRTATYLKYVDADSTGTTYTFSFTGSKWSALKAVFFSDVDAGLTLSAVPFNSGNANGTGYASTSVTTVTGAALAWSGNAAEYSSEPTHTPPTDFTETGDTALSTSAYRISPGDGLQSASGATASSAVNNKISTLLALTPASSGATVIGTASGTYGLDGTAIGTVQVVISGTASGTYGVDGTAQGAHRVVGSASGTYGWDGVASGAATNVVITGIAVGTYGVDGSAVVNGAMIDDLVDLHFIALAPELDHGAALAPESAERTALAPELTHAAAGEPVTSHADAGAPALGHGEPSAPELTHGQLEPELVHGTAGEPSL